MRAFAAILFSVIVLGAVGQLTTQTQTPFFHGAGASSGWNGTPEGLGGMALHFIYTNIPGTPILVSNWTDLVQGKTIQWNKLTTEPISTTTGVLFRATGPRDAFTNSLTDLWTGGRYGGPTGGDGTNFSIFFVFRQIDNNFGSGVMPLWSTFPLASTPYLGNINAGTAMNMNWNSINVTFTTGLNQIPIDVYMTWSNGVFWAWTNGIIADNARSWNVSGAGWGGITLGSGGVNNEWHGTLAELGMFTNVAFVTSGSVSPTVVGVSNLHWYVTNTPVLKTNGVNCIFP